MFEKIENSSDLHIHLDAVGGVAGDMFVAAMLDAFPQLINQVMTDIATVLPKSIGKAETFPAMTSGLTARCFRLVLKQGSDVARHGDDTTYASMRNKLKTSKLSPETIAAACDILHRIAEAEAKVHNIPIEKVHFHEIADWDALMDVTAAGSICAAFSNATWSISSLPLGGGFVQTAHGILPVPAPATVAILKGYKWHDDGIEGERVTPTGAAIVAHITNKYGGHRSGGELCSTGSGMGTKQLNGTPNILRASAFSKQINSSVIKRDMLVQLACDVDDMTGEEIGNALDKLRSDRDVIDVILLTGHGKKSRPMTRIELLIKPEQEDRIVKLMFDYTSTLGLRRSHIDRLILPRADEQSSKGYNRKRTIRPDGQETLKAESDDLSDIYSLSDRRKRSRSIESE